MSRPFLASSLLVAAMLASSPSAAEIQGVRGPIPYRTTADIYSTGGLPSTPAGEEIAKAGYVEEEYFVSGTGDIYASGKDGPVVEKRGIPYVTRVLIIRPKSASKFNGIVHFTGMHPFQGGVQWNWISHLVLTSGAAYVAVSTGTDANSRNSSSADWPIAGPAVTRWYDGKRYGDLRWPDDDGIRWTVFSDVARLLRSKDRTMLADLDIQYVYVSGWSFLGSFQRTYINEGFHDLFRQADGKPLIDGYAIGISSPWQAPGFLPINSHASPPPVGSPRRQLRPIDVPVIEYLSQNEGQANQGLQAPDRDSGLGRHRLYEVGGTSHRDLGIERERSYTLQLRARGHPMAKPDAACAVPATDVPQRLLFAAAMTNLHQWVEKGTPPPASAQLTFDVAQQIARDPVGNPLGGIRSVELDVPLARYGTPAGKACTTYVPQYLLMRRNALPTAELRALYPGGKADYLRRADARIDAMVTERLIRPEDRALYRAQVHAAADTAFTQ